MPKRRGRPTSGIAGSRASDYPSLTIRLPEDTKATLEALSAMRREPIWRVLRAAIEDHLNAIPDADRRLAATMVRRILAEGQEKKR